MQRAQTRAVSKKASPPSFVGESVKHIGGTFAAAFGENLAFYLVVFGGTGVVMYFVIPKVFRSSVDIFREKSDAVKESAREKWSETKGSIIGVKDNITERLEIIMKTLKEKAVDTSVGAKDKTTQSVKDTTAAAKEYADILAEKAKAKSTEIKQKGYEVATDATQKAAEKSTSIAGAIKNKITKAFNRKNKDDDEEDNNNKKEGDDN